MYAKCGELAKARDLLDQHKSRDVITWTALLTGYVRKGNGQKALDCFERMQNEGITPNAVTYSSVLKACGALRALEKGEAIHGEILKQRLLEDDFVLATALLDMYFKCGALAKAKQMSDNFSVKDAGFWNALISGYSQHGQDEQALHCFENMKCKGIIPNQGTYVCALKACSNMGDLDKGLQIHEEVASRGLLQSDSVLASAIVNMYVKCGTFPKAHAVFKKLSPQDAPSWNALITGYVLDGKCEQALSCFEQMNCRAIPPDAVTYGCILRACAVIHARKKGEQIHAEIARQGLLHNNIQLGNILIDMYVKFGALSKAHDVLKELPTRNVVSWSTLIAGYAQCGKDRQALECFEFMQHEGVPPDAITFVSMLNVCSHLGHVEEAHSLFVSMDTAYGVKPNLECCFCMIDLFGRAGHIEKAIHLVQQIPLSDSYNIWLSILGACQKYGDVHIGRWVFEQAILADENNGLAYILMANIYAAAGMQEDAMIIEAMRMSRIWKSATHSWQSTAPSNNSHVFAFDDLLYLKLPSTHMQLNSSEEDVLIK
ncbi:hypothetical protein KP509_23G075200 [Ceratopteris richardii]|nr:hypothetical protein KP509_23G075200 [Ceratopteris richardii]